jgi:hypothetical protein
MVKDKTRIPSLETIEIIEGHILGDGGLYINTNNIYFHFQYEQATTKHKKAVVELNNILFREKIKKNLHISGRPAKKYVRHDGVIINCSKTYKICSTALPFFSKLRHEWYENNKKIVRKNLVLTYRIIACWIADDGCYTSNGRMQISSHSFSLKDNQILCKKINDLFHISSAHLVKSYNKWMIYISRQDYENYISPKIAPYIPKGFEYKLATKI